ncbi:MAG TPA: exodeoxyribonuclease VII small subunit [Gemmatimonadaceae bacterium]|nr:exodeoxyribonuclease VII small subunit [Gemmatimonadaceae bacterium]
MSYEKRVERLQEIVADLEGDGLPLDSALKLFEEGIEILRLASDELTRAEGRVQLLIESAEGVFETREIDV